MHRRSAIVAAAVALTVAGVAACVDTPPAELAEKSASPVLSSPVPSSPVLSPAAQKGDIYAAAGAGMLSEAVRGHRSLVYVPNTNGDSVTVIDPATYKVIDTFYGGPEPQHVVPSYDLSTLFVTSSRVPGGGILPIDPRTGKPRQVHDVQDVYNLYFTPDAKFAVVVAEYYKRLDFYDPKTWQRIRSVEHPGCDGINHMDFTADEKVALVSCEFANRMLVIDALTGKELRHFDLDVVADGMPQDTRLVPDGSAFLVADMHANGVYVFDGEAKKRLGFIRTGRGAHGIYFSRDGRVAYVSNRDEGTVSVVDMATRKPVQKWTIPNGSPDMGGVSADGKVLWLSGRYHGEVYAIRTSDGKLLARIPVGAGPHGLTVWPQPGRYSLGHTGNIR